MAFADWLDRIWGNFTGNIDAAGSPGLAQLGAAIASAPRGYLGAGIAQGIAGFSQAAQEGKRKMGMAEALEKLGGNLSPQQRDFIKALGPDAAPMVLPLIGKGLFEKSEQWEPRDMDQDGQPDVLVNTLTGEWKAAPLWAAQRAKQNVAPGLAGFPIAPGFVSDPSGQPVPAPQPAPGGQPGFRPPVQSAPLPPPLMGQPRGLQPQAPPLSPVPLPTVPNDIGPSVLPTAPRNTEQTTALPAQEGDAVAVEPAGTAPPGKTYPVPKALIDKVKPAPPPGMEWRFDPSVPVGGDRYVLRKTEGAPPKMGEGEPAKIRDMLQTTIPLLQDTLTEYENRLDSTTFWQRLKGPAGGAAMSELKTYHTYTLMMMKEFLNLGVLNGRDYELMVGMLEDPESGTAVMRGKEGMKAQIKAVRDIFNRSLAAWAARAKKLGLPTSDLPTLGGRSPSQPQGSWKIEEVR